MSTKTKRSKKAKTVKPKIIKRVETEDENILELEDIQETPQAPANSPVDESAPTKLEIEDELKELQKEKPKETPKEEEPKVLKENPEPPKGEEMPKVIEIKEIFKKEDIIPIEPSKLTFQEKLNKIIEHRPKLDNINIFDAIQPLQSGGTSIQGSLNAKDDNKVVQEKLEKIKELKQKYNNIKKSFNGRYSKEEKKERHKTKKEINKLEEEIDKIRTQPILSQTEMNISDVERQKYITLASKIGIKTDIRFANDVYKFHEEKQKIITSAMVFYDDMSKNISEWMIMMAGGIEQIDPKMVGYKEDIKLNRDKLDLANKKMLIKMNAEATANKILEYLESPYMLYLMVFGMPLIKRMTNNPAVVELPKTSLPKTNELDNAKTNPLFKNTVIL